MTGERAKALTRGLGKAISPFTISAITQTRSRLRKPPQSNHKDKEGPIEVDMLGCQKEFETLLLRNKTIQSWSQRAPHSVRIILTGPKTPVNVSRVRVLCCPSPSTHLKPRVKVLSNQMIQCHKGSCHGDQTFARRAWSAAAAAMADPRPGFIRNSSRHPLEVWFWTAVLRETSCSPKAIKRPIYKAGSNCPDARQ